MAAKNGFIADPADLARRIAREAMEVTSARFEVQIYELGSRQRMRARVAYARQIAMYLWHVIGQLSLGEISEAFGRSRATVGHACHALEDRRDDPEFDAHIETMERELRRRLDELYRFARLKPAITVWAASCAARPPASVKPLGRVPRRKDREEARPRSSRAVASPPSRQARKNLSSPRRRPRRGGKG